MGSFVLIAFEKGHSVVAVPKECGRELRLSELGECFDEERDRGEIRGQDGGGRSRRRRTGTGIGNKKG